MPHRIEVASNKTSPEGEAIRKRIRADLGIELDSVKPVAVYTIEGDISPSELETLGQELFSDRISEQYTTGHFADGVRFDYLFEKGFKPGVTDDVGKTSSDVIKDILGKDVTVATSRQYILNGRLTAKQVEAIAAWSSRNIVEQYRIRNSREWTRHPFRARIPVVRIPDQQQVKTLDLNLSDAELGKIIKSNELALDLEGIKTFAEYYRRPEVVAERGRLNLPLHPTDVEIQVFAQSNCDHCKHTTFNGMYEYFENGRKERVDSLFRTYIKAATEDIRKRLGRKDWLVSVFSDNAGIIRFDRGYYLLFKVETHNMPSALDPEPGAETGMAVIRDIMCAGKGGRPLLYTDILCFGNPYFGGVLPVNILHPKRVIDGVRTGVEHGGNKKGVPTVNGTVKFDSYPYGTSMWNGTIQTYTRPLVYCGCGGIMPAYIGGESSHLKKAEPGDLFIKIGGRTGIDGIHGATVSSGGLGPNSPMGSVQMASAITEKKSIDFVIEARDRKLFSSNTDNGAGGLSCSGGEMANESGGLSIDVTELPLKYAHPQTWEKILSESQEINTFAVPPYKAPEFLELARRRGVEATVLGTFNDSGYFDIKDNGKLAAHLELKFLHKGLSQKRYTARWDQPIYEEPQFNQPEMDEALAKLLGRLNICSKEYFVRQYDHEVQGATVGKPLTGVNNDGPSDAAVLWPHEMQKKGSPKGVVIANGINANYGLVDTYHMAASNIDEAIRNAVAVGADPDRIALLDNFCWSSPENEYRAAQLVRTCKACYDYSTAFMAPFISGKDSMHNESTGVIDGKHVKIVVPPTLLISSIGITPDVDKSKSMDMKRPGDILYILGTTYDELGGSEYLAMLGSERNEAWVGNNVPKVNAASAKRLYRALYKAIQNDIVYSVHDASEGGLLTAVAESAFAGGIGAKIYLDRVPVMGISRDDHLAFSESQSRLLVEVPEQYAAKFESYMKGVPYAAIGITTPKERLAVYGLNGKPLLDMQLNKLKDAWQKTLGW